jgi:hypothetical protein
MGSGARDGEEHVSPAPRRSSRRPGIALALGAVAFALASSAARGGDGAPDTPTPAPTPAPSPSPVPAPSPAPPSTTEPSFTEKVKSVFKGRRLPSWLAIEEEDAPDPPAVKLEAAVIGWPYIRSSIQLGRHRGDPGVEITDVEQDVGLPRQGVSPWAEISLGAELRFGANFLDLDRTGRFRQVSQTLDTEGIILAQPGDYAEAHLHYTQVESYVLWDVLYGAHYRIGPIGGGQYTRIASRLTGVQLVGREIVFKSTAPESDLFAPFFGGHIELDPVSLFTVYADVRVVDWSWGAIGLRNQRTFMSRLGFSLSLLDGLVGLGIDFRFFSASLDTGNAGMHTRSIYEIDAAGIGLNLSCKY